MILRINDSLKRIDDLSMSHPIQAKQRIKLQLGFEGHSGSTYWRKKDSEKGEIFRKLEPYLKFLNVHQLEMQGADIQTKVEELEELNQVNMIR